MLRIPLLATALLGNGGFAVAGCSATQAQVRLPRMVQQRGRPRPTTTQPRPATTHAVSRISSAPRRSCGQCRQRVRPMTHGGLWPSQQCPRGYSMRDQAGCATIWQVPTQKPGGLLVAKVGVRGPPSLDERVGLGGFTLPPVSPTIPAARTSAASILTWSVHEGVCSLSVAST